MGEFVHIDSLSVDKHEWGPNPTLPQKLFLQLIPATVIDVVMNDNVISSPAYDGPTTINAITAKPHYASVTGVKESATTLYYPLLRGITDTPVKGDAVLLLTNTGGENYYLGPLNALNNPNYNIDPLNKKFTTDNPQKVNSKDSLNIPKNFRFANIARLQKPYKEKLENRGNRRRGEEHSTAREETYGDMLFEGRYGNSIRIGHRDNCPNIVISNGRNGVQPVETLYDGSIFTMTTHGALKSLFHNFSLASDIVEGNSRLVGGGNIDEAQQKFNYDFGEDEDGLPILRNQIFMASDKITINSRIDNITLSSYNNIDMGAGNNLTINTKNYTSIESSNIYLGKQAQEQKEKLVLGNSLKDFMVKFLNVMGKATAMVQGAPVPLTDELGVSGTPLKEYIDDLIEELESPTFLSDYHFIEDNGQKAE